MPRAGALCPGLHARVSRPAPALGRDPGDELVGVHDVTGLGVYAVGRVQVDLYAAWRVTGFDHLINARRTEILAGVAVLLHAALIADRGIADDQVCGLVLFVLRSGIIDVGQFVESQLTVTLGSVNYVGLGAAIRWQLRERFHAFVAGTIAVMRPQTTAAGNLLHAR